jgi:hypothetical protein
MMGRPPRNRLAMLGGWIFADLFLLLLLVGLAGLPAAGPVSPTPGPTATSSAGEREGGLEEEPVSFNVEVTPAEFRAGGSGRERLAEGVKDRLEKLGYQDRTPGFVLVFASGPEPGPAKATATAAFDMLHGEGRSFAPASGLGYWSGNGDHFEFKVFFLK